MAKKKRAHHPDNHQLLQAGIVGIDTLIRELRRILREANVAADSRKRGAYHTLAGLLTEIDGQAENGVSPSVSDVYDSSSELVPYETRVALAFGTNTKLKAIAKKCLKAIEKWQPTRETQRRRLPLVLGDAQKTSKVWNEFQDKLLSSPARVAEAEARIGINESTDQLLRCLDETRSVLTDKLVGRSNPDTPRKKDWTQELVDVAIRKYISDRSVEHRELKERIENPNNCLNLVEEARAIFGRNAVARNVGIRSPAMISKSPAWIALANELGLPHGPRVNAKAESISDGRVRGTDEVLSAIRNTLAPEEAEAVISKLEASTMTLAEAKATLEIMKKS